MVFRVERNQPCDVLDVTALCEDIPYVGELSSLDLFSPFLPSLLACFNLFEVGGGDASGPVRFG